MKIPVKSLLTSLYGLHSEGYQFIGKTCEELKTDLFRISLFGFQVICMRGEDAAALFYDTEKMQRKGAVPKPVQKTLTGKDAIHTRDGQVHHQRKGMFLSLMTDEHIERLSELFNIELHARFIQWQRLPSVCLFEEMSQALCVAICQWADVPLKDEEVGDKAADFVAMVDAFGAIGLRNLKGRKARKRAERWIVRLIAKGRSGQFKAGSGSAFDLVLHYREADGQLLDDRMAAIELINILRPTVAIAWYIVFAVTALQEHPEWRRKFETDADDDQLNFINEVRRFYPFAPFMGAKVRNGFDWQGYNFRKGALVLLDMYGTNHDARLWDNPHAFDPNRFKGRQIKPFDFLAQGGGSVTAGHRCPGETITIALLKNALRFLVAEIQYTVPHQNLSIDLSRMPTMPKSRLVISNIRKPFA